MNWRGFPFGIRCKQSNWRITPQVSLPAFLHFLHLDACTMMEACRQRICAALRYRHNVHAAFAVHLKHRSRANLASFRVYLPCPFSCSPPYERLDSLSRTAPTTQSRSRLVGQCSGSVRPMPSGAEVSMEMQCHPQWDGTRCLARPSGAEQKSDRADAPNYTMISYL